MLDYRYQKGSWKYAKSEQAPHSQALVQTQSLVRPLFSVYCALPCKFVAPRKRIQFRPCRRVNTPSPVAVMHAHKRTKAYPEARRSWLVHCAWWVVGMVQKICHPRRRCLLPLPAWRIILQCSEGPPWTAHAQQATDLVTLEQCYGRQCWAPSNHEW